VGSNDRSESCDAVRGDVFKRDERSKIGLGGIGTGRFWRGGRVEGWDFD